MEVHIYSSNKAIVATDVVKDKVTTQKGQSRKKAKKAKVLRCSLTQTLTM